MDVPANNGFFSNISTVLHNPGRYIADNVRIIPYILETNKDVKDLQGKISKLGEVLLSNNPQDTYDYLKQLKSNYEILKERVGHIEKWSTISNAMWRFQFFINLPRFFGWTESYINAENTQKYYISEIITYVESARYILGTLLYKCLWKGKKIPEHMDHFLNLMIGNLSQASEHMNNVEWGFLKDQFMFRYINIIESNKEKDIEHLDKALDAFRNKLLEQKMLASRV